MSITQEQHWRQALMLLNGAAKHLHMLDEADPYRDLAVALGDAIEERFAALADPEGS